MSNKKILVVEDEFSINDTLCFALKMEGYIVKSAFNGNEALIQVEEFKPDLVLLDIMLPDINGFDICKKISDKTLIIFLTARDDVIDRILGVEIGGDDYITKPFEMREVTARIRAVFRRIEKIDKTFINNYKNDIKFKIDEDNRSVIKNGQEIYLKRKEFDLLWFLYKNRNKVFSRDELLDKIWGYDFIGDTRTVDVHIRRLRVSLNEDKDNSIIETVFGVGYVMR